MAWLTYLIPNSQDFIKGFPQDKNVVIALDNVHPVPWVFRVIIFLFLIYINISISHIYFKILFLIIFLSIELSWSMGTFNWGTAIRHHICSLGILSIFTAFLFEIKKNEK